MSDYIPNGNIILISTDSQLVKTESTLVVGVQV